MSTTMPRWAQNLLKRHPGAAIPTAENPVPEWLEAEAQRTPLWYIIREAAEVRTAHPYLVYDEIRRQPAQWGEILAGSADEVARVAASIRDAGIDTVIFTGCGSAFFTALHGAWTWGHYTGLKTAAVESLELIHYFPQVDPARTLLVAHSGTGGSIETIDAVRVAKARGVRTLALTNTDVSPILNECDDAIIYLTKQGCGPCISVVSTRILLQTMIARHLARPEVDLGLLDASLAALPAAGEELLAQFTDKIADFAERTTDIESVFLVGTGPNYFSAREGTLKIEEQSLLVGKAYRPGDFHHDALSLLNPSRLVITIAAPGHANDRIIDVLRASREGKSPTLGVEYGAASGLSAFADETWQFPGKLDEGTSPVLLTLPFQLLGYFMGVQRGRNPDTLATDKLTNARAWLTAFPLGTH